MIVISTLSTALLILITSCRKSLKEFTFSYSMESKNSYKMVMTLSGDKTYKIERYNYIDNSKIAGNKDVIDEGIMDEEKFKAVRKLIQKSNFLKMKDRYEQTGRKEEELNDMLYHIFFSTKGKEKNIFIQNNKSEQFPEAFTNLVDFIHNFIKTRDQLVA